MRKEPYGLMPIFAHRCMHHEIYGKRLQYETYKSSQILHSINDTIDHFGMVVDGVLKAEQYTSQGSVLCSAYFEDNDVFPELLYFTGKRQYTYTLVAVRRTTVAWMHVSDLEEMLKEDTEMMTAFMLYLSKRGLRNQMLLSCLMYQTIQQRVAYWLLSMNHLSEHERIPLPRSQTIWANTLHVSRSSLNQELKRMEKEGIFRIEGHALILLDQKKAGGYFIKSMRDRYSLCSIEEHRGPVFYYPEI